MTKKITIINTMHNTKTSTTIDETMVVPRSRVRRIRRTLCGMAGCTCGGNLSERGDSDLASIIDADGEMLIPVPRCDGSVELEYA